MSMKQKLKTNKGKAYLFMPVFFAVLFLSMGFQLYDTYEQGQDIWHKLSSPQVSSAIAQDAEGNDEEAQGNLFNETVQAPERDFIDELEYSSSELEILQSLAKRREELQQKEAQLQQKEALLAAAEKQLESKMSELGELRGEIEKLLGQQQEEQEARINSLVKMYETMKSKDAARILDTLDMDVLISVMGRMSERKAAPILAEMNPDIARQITIKLAEQKMLPDMDEDNQAF